MRDDFDALIADRFAVLVHVPVPDTWSRVQSKLVVPTPAPFTDAEPTMIDLEAPTRSGDHRKRRTLIGALVGVAAAASLIGALVVVSRRDDPDRLPPVDSTPPSVPVTTAPAPMTTASVPVDSSPTTAPPPTATVAPTQVFTDLPAGSSVEMPAAPIDGADVVARVWSGTELIVWSDVPDPPGAAFNLATGTWRLIPPAPIDSLWLPGAVWTGTEMIVWGRSPLEATTRTTQGAAYNPVTDAWRRLPDAPIDAPTYPSMVWTGEEVAVVGGAAYDPVTNQWRLLAPVPGSGPLDPDDGAVIWTGTHILVPLSQGAADDPSSSYILARYDLSTDTWSVDREVDYRALVGVPDADGVARTVIAMPHHTGAPAVVLDSGGEPIGMLPGVPDGGDGDVAPTIRAHGVWVDDEAVFWITGEEEFTLFPSEGPPPEVWALNPATQTWRLVLEDDPTFRLLEKQFAAGDVLVGWGSNDNVGHITRLPPAPTD